MAEKKLKNYIHGKWVESSTTRYLEIVDSTNAAVVALCPDSTMDEVDAAVESAKSAFPAWRNTIPTRRADCLYALRDNLLAARDELAEIIVLEHGKTLSDAKGELMRAIQYVEHPCGISELLKGSISEDVGTGVDEYFIREPLGVFAILPPFNFPAMIALYFTWPVACGNTVVVKPSELCPMTMLRITEIAEASGFPQGVLNVVNGGPQVGDRLCTHPDVAGVTFVGSSRVAEMVYKSATSVGKRAQCQGGAKNHVVVMPDAVLDEVIPNLVNSCFGHTSQRCFAVSNVLVHQDIYDMFRDRFLEACRALKLGGGMDPGVDMGPLVSSAALDRMHIAIEHGLKHGATLLLDGRNQRVDKYPKGFFLGPTVLEAEPDSFVFSEEIFGPVRCMKRVQSLTEAIDIVNRSLFGHTAVIYTESGGWARRFIREVETGQVGINIGTPAPIAFYPVGGRKISFYGSHRGRANDAVDFYTDKKVVVTRWNAGSGATEVTKSSKKAEPTSVVF
ncbi:MAG: CoA-acylating methylmalonate-semialdehyde dehydrogenase [Desulfomonile tiedjei]|nr:CoA-acylating methylmalonate-semialdehyde dehydrogenase [Desulfomonile tiedjei]